MPYLDDAYPCPHSIAWTPRQLAVDAASRSCITGKVIRVDGGYKV
jgi:hypothetical protein